VRAAAELGIRLIWAQPGTHDDALLALARSLDLCVLEDCVLAATEDRIQEED
jgi:predicted CoA-binding protein